MKSLALLFSDFSTSNSASNDEEISKPEACGMGGNYGNKERSRRYRRLDTWDAGSTNHGDVEMFALCDLDYRDWCRNYYVPSNSLEYECRE